MVFLILKKLQYWIFPLKKDFHFLLFSFPQFPLLGQKVLPQYCLFMLQFCRAEQNCKTFFSMVKPFVIKKNEKSFFLLGHLAGRSLAQFLGPLIPVFTFYASLQIGKEFFHSSNVKRQFIKIHKRPYRYRRNRDKNKYHIYIIRVLKIMVICSFFFT